jgi:hypothetical protein
MEKTKFGFGQIENKTPLWAKNIFRITLLLTFVATFVIASDPEIPAKLAVRIGVYLKALDLLVFGLSKMFGVKIEVSKKFKK